MSDGDVREVEARRVMFVETTDLPGGIATAFHDLEARLPTLRQRRFFGVMFAARYWAAVELTPTDDPERMGLQVGEVPGGRYACKKLKDWDPAALSRVIPETFQRLTSGRTVDPTRPFVEFYRSQRELILQATVAS